MNLYTPEFYRAQQAESLCSARRILQIVFEALNPKSVLDVGCGVGTWLRAAMDLGVQDIMGLDGKYVDREMLMIAPRYFEVMDLGHPDGLDRRFDLTLCLEVAEHLPKNCAQVLTRFLVSTAPVILFSAAIPGQGGTGHVNEQWQTYWISLFKEQGYKGLDLIRPVVWDAVDVEYWYAQNSFVFVDEARLSEFPLLLKGASGGSLLPISMVHPRAFAASRMELETLKNRGLRSWLFDAPRVFSQTWRNRTRRNP